MTSALNEFFRLASQTKMYESVAAVQEDFDACLVHYTTERPHLGYRNNGRRPLETMNEYLESVREAA